MNIDLPKDLKRPGQICVLVFGGRHFDREEILFHALDLVLMQCEARAVNLTILQGGAPGADQLARDWASYQDGDVELITENAEWQRLGRSAGPKRNQAMLDKYNPDYYVAMPGGPGTADMTQRCKTAGIPGAIYNGARAPGP